MQPSDLFSDVPLHPDDRSQTGLCGCQPDRATGLVCRRETQQLVTIEVRPARLQTQAKKDGNVAADPVLFESPTYTAPCQQCLLNLKLRLANQVYLHNKV